MALACGDRSARAAPLHQPAMVPQVIDLLEPGDGETALDLTVGTGGHSLALAEGIGPRGLLMGIDADPDALRRAEERLRAQAPCEFRLFPARFSAAPEVAARAGVERFDCIMADLGVGTHQLLDPERGLSFDSHARLDMRYDRASGPTAWDVVNEFSERDLADVFHRYGEERYSRAIAARICRERPVDTPAELAELVKKVAARRTPRGRTWRIHPATRVMMALRIYVNNELGELESLLESLPGLLADGGRAAIITYHSLEARPVKQTWRRQVKEGLLRNLTPSPLKPTQDEVRANPHVRSAQLRAVQRTRGVQ